MNILSNLFGKNDTKIHAKEIAMSNGWLISDLLQQSISGIFQNASEKYYAYPEGITVSSTSTNKPGHGYPSGDYALIITVRTSATRVWQVTVSHDNKIWSRTGTSTGDWTAWKSITMA